MTPRCAIIIPSIEFNNDLKKCLVECLKQKKVKVKIFVITNKKTKNKLNSKKILYLNYGNINMSTKRNIAAKKCSEEFIAFIDSDAYPSRNWLYNAIKILKKRKDIGMVTGPDLPFKNQKGLSYVIGLAHKSFLLSGDKIYRKNLISERICLQASSCNMILKKNLFEKVKGMDQNIYIGEDKDFCDRFNLVSKIFYSPKVLIFHKVRNFLPFLFQRFSYGASLLDLIKTNTSFNLNNLQYFIPLIIVCAYFFAPLFYIQENIFFYVYMFTIFLLNFLIFVESIRITINPFRIFIIFFIIKINILAFGLGSIFGLLGFKKLKEIYTRR